MNIVEEFNSEKITLKDVQAVAKYLIDSEYTKAEQRVLNALFKARPQKLSYLDLAELTGYKVATLRNILCQFEKKKERYGWMLVPIDTEDGPTLVAVPELYVALVLIADYVPANEMSSFIDELKKHAS